MNNHEHCDDPNCELHHSDLDTLREKQKKCMERDGWYAHLVSGDPNTATGINFHTHGLEESFSHLDLQLVIGLPPATVNYIFRELIDRIKEGSKFKNGDIAENVSNNYCMKFVEVIENGRKVLRIIIPDDKNNFDRDTIKGGLEVQYADI